MDDRSIVRRIAAVMAFESATLVVASIVHLSGNVHGRSEPFDAEHAGIAEAVIGTVLACGALTMLHGSRRTRAVGLGTTSFAIAGFLLGLNLTARGGDLPDVAYHVTMLPVLIGTLVVTLRMRQSGSRSAVWHEGPPPSGVVTQRR
jgi:hypothetical protein